MALMRVGPLHRSATFPKIAANDNNSYARSGGAIHADQTDGELPRDLLRAVLRHARARILQAGGPRRRTDDLGRAGRRRAEAARWLGRCDLGRADAGDAGARSGPALVSDEFLRGGFARPILPDRPQGRAAVSSRGPSQQTFSVGFGSADTLDVL